jgi:hypothetical protein
MRLAASSPNFALPPPDTLSFASRKPHHINEAAQLAFLHTTQAIQLLDPVVVAAAPFGLTLIPAASRNPPSPSSPHLTFFPTRLTFVCIAVAGGSSKEYSSSARLYHPSTPIAVAVAGSRAFVVIANRSSAVCERKQLPSGSSHTASPHDNANVSLRSRPYRTINISTRS